MRTAAYGRPFSFAARASGAGSHPCSASQAFASSARSSNSASQTTSFFPRFHVPSQGTALPRPPTTSGRISPCGKASGSPREPSPASGNASPAL